MGLTTKYFSNTTNFEEITESLRKANNLPETIDTGFLEQLGFTDPADALILNFFKELRFLKDDNTPTALFEKFRNEQTSKEAFAYGVLEAYGDLFEADPKIYQQSKDEITKVLEAALGDEKSNIIISYMVNTFKTLVDYVGQDTLTAVLEQKKEGASNIEIIVKEIAEKHNGNKSATNPTEKNNSSPDEAQSVEGQKEAESKSSDVSSEELSRVDAKGTDVTNGSSKAVGSAMDGESKKNGVASVSKEKQNGSTDTDRSSGNIPTLTSDKSIMQTVSSSTRESEYINKAYIKKAALLHKMERFEEALPALDQVFQRFANSDNEELYEQASVALLKKMDAAEKLQKSDTLIPIYERVIDRLHESGNTEFIESVDHACISLAEMLLKNNQHDQALEAIEQAIKRFKNTQRRPDFLARAMYKKAELLEELGSDQEALEAFDVFLKTFE